MPRNSSGTYSLYTPGNPVVTNTVISSTWANNTLADLASALTDSLSRTGDGGMQAPLQLTNGAVGAPALTWATETTSGWYRASAGNFRFSISAADVLTLTAAAVTIASPTVIGSATGGAQGAGTINATGVYDDGVLLANQTGANPTGSVGLSAVNGVATTFMRSDGAPALSVSIVPTWTGEHKFSGTLTGDSYTSMSGISLSKSGGTDPVIWFRNSGAAAAQKNWAMFANTASFNFVIYDDSGLNQRDILAVGRSAGAITSLAFGNTTNNPTYSFLGTGASAFGGDVTFTVGSSRGVGYRGMPSRTITTSDSTAATDNGRSILFTGAGSQTFTVDSDFGAAENICVVLNGGTGALSIAESLSGTMTWLNGGGSLSTGTRTLAIGGIATIWMVDANNAYIWGVGLT